MKRYTIVFVVGLVIVCISFKYRTFAQGNHSPEVIEREVKELESQKQSLEEQIKTLEKEDLSDYMWVNPLTQAKEDLANIKSRIRTRKEFLAGRSSFPY